MEADDSDVLEDEESQMQKSRGRREESTECFDGMELEYEVSVALRGGRRVGRGKGNWAQGTPNRLCA